MSEKKKKYGIIILVIASCIFMSFVETVIEPIYIVKSALKIVVFLFFPLLSMKKADIKIFDSSFNYKKSNFARVVGVFSDNRHLFYYEKYF